MLLPMRAKPRLCYSTRKWLPTT
jgi:hypothetical protein